MGSILHSIKEIVSFITAIFILILLVILLGYMVYSLPYIVPHMGDKNFFIPIYIAIPFPLLLFFLQGMQAYIWYIFLVSAIAISSTIMVIYGVIPYFKEFVSSPFSYKSNAFQDLGEMFALNLFFSLLIVFILYFTGYTPQTPGIGNMPIWMQMMQLLHASVYEELITRTLFLGIPVFAIYALRREKISPWRILGGYGRITAVEVIFIVISASIFAVAHVPAWNLWKIAPTFVGGLLLGYLYIKYGIHASILLHFLTDFMSIPSSLSPQLQIVIGILIIYFALVGLLFFVSFSLRAFNYLTGKRQKTEKIREERKEEKREMNTWINLSCPHCGGRVFQYVDENTLRCVTCGTIIKLKEEEEEKIELP